MRFRASQAEPRALAGAELLDGLASRLELAGDEKRGIMPRAAMSEILVTEKHRMERRFFDHATRRLYPSISQIPGRRELNEQALRIFLRLGYVPGHGTLFRGVDCLPGGCEIRLDESGWRVASRFRFSPSTDRPPDAELQRRGLALLRAATSKALSSRMIVLPLSGGLDSRTLLGLLLEQREAREIVTYTYGLPGTLDFEIGNRVARWAGTRHVVLDLRGFAFTKERVQRTLLMSDANTEVLKPSVWVRVLETFGLASQYWSGFTGDGLGGSHYLPDSGGVEAAVRDYVAGDTRTLQFHDLAEWREEDAWPVARETKYDQVLSAHEAVWFENHVERYTAHHIFMHGVSYATPFMDDPFAAFALALPPELRQSKRFFNRLVTGGFPKLFALPTRSYGYGLARRRLRQALFRGDQAWRKAAFRALPALVRHPGVNYIDFSHAVRARPDVQGLVREAMASLGRRDVLDARRVAGLLADHLAGKRDTSALLTLLTSLELMLQTLCDRAAASSAAA